MIETSYQDELRLVLRSLQLPLSRDGEEAALEGLIEYSELVGLSPDDLAIIIQEQLNDWGSSDEIGEHLGGAIKISLEFAPSILSRVDINSYFAMYQKLRSGTKDSPALPHSVARRLLSRGSLIAHLLEEELFSCSQVSRLLHATEESLDVSYGAVAVLARGLGILPGLNPHSAGEVLWDTDARLALLLFPDTSLPETNEIASNEVDVWLPESEFENFLDRLSRRSETEGGPTWPYLQMLHWCLTPLEFYDHPASYLYEFSPRGKVALSLFDKYPAVTGNPVLNNAKAVERLNSTWARNRGSDDAHALVEILELLETLPFIPRMQIARVLRAWLIRVVEIQAEEPTTLAYINSNHEFVRVSEFVSRRETNTQGVIEQRIVDCWSVLAFQKNGWRSRGLGDGVNASNLSRKKLGDIEYANVDERTAIAIEAHGGYLSYTYVADHQRSLARIIEQRLTDSWLALDDPEAWTVRVIFVAHGWEQQKLPTREKLHGVNVLYDYIFYGDLRRKAVENSTESERINSYNLHVIDALNRRIVRESTREVYSRIAQT